MSDVTQLSLWFDFPWKAKLPSWVEVRCSSEGDDGQVLVFWSPEHQLHVDVAWGAERVDEAETPEFWERYAAPMLNNLGGAIFEKKHPDQLAGMLRRQAHSVVHEGVEWPEADRALWVEYKSLTTF